MMKHVLPFITKYMKSVQDHTLLFDDARHVNPGEWLVGDNLAIKDNFHNCIGIKFVAMDSNLPITTALVHFNTAENSANALNQTIRFFDQWQKYGYSVKVTEVLNQTCASDQTGVVTRHLQDDARNYVNHEIGKTGFCRTEEWVSRTGFALGREGNIVEKSSVKEWLSGLLVKDSSIGASQVASKSTAQKIYENGL